MAENPEAGGSGLALIEYPGRYPLKVLGRDSEEFVNAVLDLVRAGCPEAEHIEVRRRLSKGGKYLALTLTFTVHSQQQLEQIYHDMYNCEQVVMAL